MTQSDIDRAVARRTGETTRRIRQMGLVLLIPAAPHHLRLDVRQPCPEISSNDTQALSNTTLAIQE